ncbi:thiosulfate sulfurtransferase [Oryzomicrobium terrae]|uniref:Thiosulfate sulfurtransferase n=1 Tax=Oryzomicrobium terrae TaxID=1735038 RepID=A0A5C1EBM0_9RHOO|nr:rhodanese-like domain-containing protein [Oryzomicrobium terrae]QEL66282.1 thiosulfate sulfurtransferase [Oryzomicrobium terrae]
MQNLSPRDLADWLADPDRAKPLLLDVREPWEFALCHLPNSRHVPMGQIPARWEELNERPEGLPVVCICHHGGRSMQVAMFIERAGVEPVFNLAGGVHGWAADVDPAMPTY